MQRWPWITLLLAAVVAVTPPGLQFIYAAFFSNEQLSRNIAQPLVLMALAAVVVLALIEFGIRYLIYRAR